MIKTTIPPEDLPTALQRHQRWVDRHREIPAAISADQQYLEAHRQRRADALAALKRDNTTLKHRLRMAKAGLAPR